MNSAWRLLLRVAYKLPAGKYRAGEFESFELSDSAINPLLRFCCKRGFLERHLPANNSTADYKYSITRLGADLVESRIAFPHLGKKGGKRKPSALKNTWMSMLPRPGAMRPVLTATSTSSWDKTQWGDSLFGKVHFFDGANFLLVPPVFSRIHEKAGGSGARNTANVPHHEQNQILEITQ